MNEAEALKILGLEKGCSVEERKRAYKKATKKYHPDLNPTPAAEKIMRLVNEANDYLETHVASIKGLTHNSIFDIVES